MNFVDYAVIKIKAGKGGDGSASFRHEKFIPKGGPDGGDGGDGGSIIFRSSHDKNTLLDFQRQKFYKAENGIDGQGKKCAGAKGQDLIIDVPVGTIIREVGYEDKKDLGLENLEIIKKELKDKKYKTTKVHDFKKDNEEIVIADGGKGGIGNVHFKSSTNQAPRQFTRGGAGEEKILEIELRLIADVGIIGLPNAGKSTLISVISSARPEIADYPFTTIIPNLGVVEIYDKKLVFCDIPGLIEGAHAGKGLGDKFLRHVKRTGILLHLLDANSENIEKDYKTIRAELEKYDKKILDKKEIIAISKIDVVPDWKEKHKKFIAKYKPLAFSSITKEGLDEVLKGVVRLTRWT